MNNKLSRWISWIVVLTGLLFAIGLFSLCVGSASVAMKDIIPLMIKGKGTAAYSILFNIRLPRIILGFAVGGALSLAGVILQGMFRNPLVEPYTLGISGAAALGVCLNIVLRLSARANFISLPVSGFLGAAAAFLLLYSLSLRRGMLKMQGLLLIGVMISFISSALIMLIMALSRSDDLHGIIFWIMGSLTQPEWFLIKIMLGVSLISLVIAYLFSIELNALSLGEEGALHLGINIGRTKHLLFIVASVLTGCSVSIVGIIGFVGLVVPHFVRLFVGEDHRILLAASFLCGGIFLILCDTLARTVAAPVELPVGVITGILGGSLFIYALTRKQIIPGAGRC